MDRIDIYTKGAEIFKKYKYVLLILFVGIILMMLPDKEKEAPHPQISTEQKERTPAEELESILTEISGVGKVKVMLTEAVGTQTCYQIDEDRSLNADTESIRTETVIVTKSDRGETGLICSVTPPIYRGAIIVCQGGDNPTIKLSVVQAVSNVTGISSDRITVLKMK